jgi:hypothetical protein
MASVPVFNSENISKITNAEKKITGSDKPVKGGPTAQAQSHVGEPLNSQTLHDITEGEKKAAGGERVKGGPTSIAQSILGRARNGTSNTNNTNTNSAKAANTSNNTPGMATFDSNAIFKITNAEKRFTGSENPVPGGPTKRRSTPISPSTAMFLTTSPKVKRRSPGIRDLSRAVQQPLPRVSCRGVIPECLRLVHRSDTGCDPSRTMVRNLFIVPDEIKRRSKCTERKREFVSTKQLHGRGLGLESSHGIEKLT